MQRADPRVPSFWLQLSHLGVMSGQSKEPEKPRGTGTGQLVALGLAGGSFFLVFASWGLMENCTPIDRRPRPHMPLSCQALPARAEPAPTQVERPATQHSLTRRGSCPPQMMILARDRLRPWSCPTGQGSHPSAHPSDDTPHHPTSPPAAQ